MCTMTWFVRQSGYELFFNRDEHISRSRAQVPTVQYIDDVCYISPTDGDAGGTWISANQFGVSVCLLNHYQFEQIATYKKWVSRGEIVRSFVNTKSLISAELKFKALDLDDYRAFRMFVIDRFGNNFLCVWDGHHSRIEKSVSSPKSSSSVDAQYVKSLRKKLFLELGLNTSQNTSNFIEYHAGHMPNKSQESVCMHRADANTVSLSHIVVDSNRVNFSYADGAPCEAKLSRTEGIVLTPVVDEFIKEHEISLVKMNR